MMGHPAMPFPDPTLEEDGPKAVSEFYCGCTGPVGQSRCMVHMDPLWRVRSEPRRRTWADIPMADMRGNKA